MSNRSEIIWQPAKHLPSLDGTRGLAIALVTLYRFGKEFPTDSYAGWFLHNFFTFGGSGVELFFVLSGFLITGILIESKQSKHAFRNFLARRALRIFPLYFVALALLLVVVPWIYGSQNPFSAASQRQFALWTYASNLQMSWENSWCFGRLDHFWSLAVEEHFYLLWPVVVLFCTERNILRIALGIAIVVSVARICCAMLGVCDVALDVLSIFRCDALLIGSALAVAIRHPQWLMQFRRWLVPAFCLLILITLFGVVRSQRLFTIPHTVTPIAWAAVLMFLMTSQPNRAIVKFFELPVLRRLGQYSYAMYIFQSPLIPLVAPVLSVSICTTLLGDQIAGHLLYIALMFLLTYGAALISWNCLEKHCIALKRFFPQSCELRQSNTSSVREPAIPVFLPR